MITRQSLQMPSINNSNNFSSSSSNNTMQQQLSVSSEYQNTMLGSNQSSLLSSSLSSQQVIGLLKKLIKINISKGKQQTDEEYEQYVNRQLRFLSSLLSSRISPTLVQTQDQILLTETIKKRLTRENKSDTIFHFSQLYHKLNSKKVIQNKFNLVYLLNSLGIFNSQQDNSISSLNMTFQDNLFKLNSTTPQRQETPSVIHQSQEIRPKSSLTEQYKQSFSEQENTKFEIAESVLVRDIMYTFQGIDGKYIKFDIGNERYIVDTKIGIPKSTRLLMSKLSELGWLYKKVKSFVDSGTLNITSNGLIVQSLCAAIDKELVDYYKTLSTLETHIESQENTNTPVTFRRLAVWAIEPTEIMKNLAVLVDSCKFKKGGVLISTIFTFLKHGDPLVQQLFVRILDHASSPIFRMLKSWVIDGELEDPYAEFFIKSDPEIQIDRLWRAKYCIDVDMVPLYIDRELANKILRTGKTINFIRQCCKDSEWSMDASTKASTDGLGFHNISKLENVVDCVAKVANKRVIDLMLDQFKFLLHCKAIKQYLLLGQGDFIQHLIELLNNDLKKPTNQIFKHNLLGLLESAIRGSNAQFDEPDVLNRLDIALKGDQASSSNSDINGWDLFYLDYKITVPLDTVLSSESMKGYYKIFKFLLNIKRVELSLNENWKKVVNLIRSIPRKKTSILSQLLGALNFSILLRHDMSRFLKSLQFYLMFEVLECAWDQFIQDVKQLRENDGDLDQLLQAHYRFLTKVAEQCFVSKHQVTTRLQVEQMLIIMNKFIGLQDILCSIASNLLSRVENFMEDDEDPTHDYISDEDKQQLTSLQQCHTQLFNIKNSFERLSNIINIKTEH